MTIAYRHYQRWCWLFLALFALTDPVFAAGAGGMPWEAPLTQIQASLTGPVAMALSMIGVTVAGGLLIFGGELGEFARRIIMLVLVIALLLTANAIITTLFGAVTAVI